MAKLTVSFQGERGSYSEEAARVFFGDDLQPLPQRSFADVFGSVETKTTDCGIVPIENSLIGSIHQNYDLLLKSDLKIIGEQDLRIAHTLIANPGVTIDQIKEVYSHPAALEQCKAYLEAHAGFTALPTYDTAGAVKLIKEKGMVNAAAVAGRFAAETYEMEILAESIEDQSDNQTRFLILSRSRSEEVENCKTSIVFALKNLPGVLFKALSVFALRDIDLAKIESRPLRRRGWEYYFYLDFYGHSEVPPGKNALAHLREITSFLKILGSYPAAKFRKGSG